MNGASRVPRRLRSASIARGYVASECPSTGVCCESVPDDLDIARRSYVLEVWEAPAGLQGRWYQVDRPQRDSPRAPYCGRSDQRLAARLGEVHLSPDALEHPDDAHGFIRAAYADADGLELTIRF